MPKRPATSGYARIAQAEEEEEELPLSDDDDYFGTRPILSTHKDARFASVQPPRKERMHMPAGSGATSPSTPKSPRIGRRQRSNSGVDIKAINARLERWAEEIKQRFTIRRIKGKSAEEEQLEIHHSVFQAPDWIRPATKQSLELDYDSKDASERMSKTEFDDIVESVRTAIELGMQPKLISQGSSGSYFARNSGGKVVGVFKPKDEEPYASKNPKWTKWIHRNLFPFFFGRACLIPNLSYVSEAAAYVLDCQLRTNLVPYTDVVSLSSKSFHYDFWDRHAHSRKRKPLPDKQGSFQVFLQGYKGATQFFREHPWPDQRGGNFRDAPNKRKRRSGWQDCRPGSTAPDDSDEEELRLASRDQSRSRREFWSDELQESFREQLEKLVILDYIMRNTDRGLDNWMIRIDRTSGKAEIVAEPPRTNGSSRRGNGTDELNTSDQGYHRRKESMTTKAAHAEDEDIPRIGAIDNSLSWPWKHPDAWRSYPFGWLFLPVSLIGRPFSESTRRHFLPLLTSKDWWSDTQVKLRKVFEIDADFKERMFARQMAVMKGQAWNVVETLKEPQLGPLELTRRERVCVWDDLVDVPVAVPLNRPSEEMRRKAQAFTQANNQRKPNGIEEEEEMDIAAAGASAPQPTHDLLGITASPIDVANSNPFNHSRQNSPDALDSAEAQQANGLLSPTLPSASMPSTTQHASTLKLPGQSSGGSRPRTQRAATSGRVSYETPRRLFPETPSQRRRRYSLVVGRGGRLSGEFSVEEDGDLGYAAASDQEMMKKKVIVERLEMVKSKVPVFTWC